MAITTMDGLVSALGGAQKLIVNKANVTAVAGRTLSLWSGAGQPGVGSTTIGNATSGAVPVSTDTGSLGFVNPVSGNSYIGGIRGISAATGLIIIYDMLWAWSSPTGWVVTTTGAQSTSSPTALTRPDANGVNSELWIETISAGGSASGTSTITYTNSAGTGSKTATLLSGAPISSPPIGTIQMYGLTAGDNGVKSVQSINNSATWTSGIQKVMIVRRVAEVPCQANVGFSYNAIDLGMTRVYDSAALGVAFNANSTASGPTQFTITLAQG